MPSVFPPGARLGSRYRVARVVAHGPSAALYEGQDLESGETVAFKWLHAPDDQHASLSRLADRAREAQRLRDPRLVEVLDVAREDDSLFVVSRWERGEPYSHLLAQHLMPLSQRLAALAATLGALEVAHRAGLAHCGLHPDNLFLSSRSGVSVKLLDLALNQTCCASMFGLPQQVAAGHHVFMAPEQLEPRYTPNLRSDLFAAAALAFQALTGRLPFIAPDAQALRAQFAHEPPRVDLLRSDVPRSLALLLAACLSRRPEQRPAELAELRAELEKFARVVVPQPAPESAPEPPSMSVTQALLRGQLVVTPAQEREPEQEPEPETESVSQPISHHGQHLVGRRWDLRVAATLAAGALLFALGAALLPARQEHVARMPPPLPELPAAEAPAAAPMPVTMPDAAKPLRARKKRHHERREDFRAGRPLTRDDF